ncbi:MAG: ComF family protein [Candidatus Staskawiczbacteria bacterium]|nr:ComF family protein [Candidatus Staskawiczbacteria bacterium]MBI3337178.1 ComF family protein [Candidatus Staskawiczbacteria bacterium]
MNKIVGKIKNFLLELFFPIFCLGCRREGVYLCQDCKAILEISEFQYCLCGKNPLKINLELNKYGKCNKCSDKKLSGLYFALPYKESALTRKLIHQFKYQPYIKDLAKTLALLLAEHFLISGSNKEDVWRDSILIPIPLDKKKLKNRGYNQAEELAKELFKILKVPVFSDILIKIKTTLSQVELSGKEREQNLKNAFAINPVRNQISNGVKKSFDFFRGKKIFLVDDVYTTGSTMEECANILKKAGAKQVWGIVIAREG